jgi:hypothetical protein
MSDDAVLLKFVQLQARARRGGARWTAQMGPWDTPTASRLA